ncbi:MAG: hypothetical protein IPK81_05465 [Rhodospirillales bacterium]|nr:MAG: hypothetical protein IPK81_05465 [Rhodospirillales bacterium]
MIPRPARAAAFAAVLGAVGAAHAQLGALPPFDQWKEHVATEDGFAVRVPNVVKGRDWKDGGLPARHYVTGNPEETYSVTAVRIPASTRTGIAAEEILGLSVKRMLEAAKPEKVERDEAQGCPQEAIGKSIQARLADEMVYAARVCVTADNVYKVEAFITSARWAEAEPSVKGFLDSFRPLRK